MKSYDICEFHEILLISVKSGLLDLMDLINPLKTLDFKKSNTILLKQQ